MSAALSGSGQPHQCLRRWRHGAAPDGQRTPQPLPLRAAADRRRRPGRDRRQRRAVRPAVRGAGRRRTWSTDPRFARNQDRTANREELRALAGGGARPADPAGVVRRAHRGRRAVRADQQRGRGRAVRRPTSGSSRSPWWAPVPRPCPRSATRSASPARRPGTSCRRRHWTSTARELRAWLAGRPESLMSRDSRPGRRAPDLPHVAGRLRRHEHPAARPRPGRRPDGPGRLRRAGAVDAGPAPAHAGRGAGLRVGPGRAGRPRLHADGHRGPGDLSVGTGLVAGRAGRGPARRRLALPRGDRGLRARSWPTSWPARPGPPTDDAGWDAVALDAVRKARAAGRFVPGWAIRCTRSSTRGRRR